MSIEDFFYNKYQIERNEKNIYGYYYDKSNRIRVENERTLQHLTYLEIMDRKKWFDIDKIDTILMSVRNPFERIVSEIFWNKKTGANELTTKEDFFKILHKYLYIDKDVFIDNHKTPQYKYILDAQNLLMKDVKIVRTETLNKDMHSLGFTDFNIHINENTVTKKNYREYLNKDSIELIKQYYAADFLYFGYSTSIEEESSISSITSSITSSIIPSIIPSITYPTTFVTAFIRDVNQNRSLTDYIEFGKKLLREDVPKVVFIDNRSYTDFFANGTYPNTEFIMFEITDMYLDKLRPLITDFNLETENPNKDTMNYIFVQCYKTEWVRMAIEKNVYGSQQFIWIDFGIFHMIRNENVLKNGLIQMSTKSYNKLRIATCKFREYVCPYNVYKRLTWNFAGSVFGGDIKSLTTFADITKEKIINTINEKQTIMWELCVWYLIKDVVPDLYDCYICGHDFRILESY